MMAPTQLPICLADLSLIITYTYAALELMGLLQAACFTFQGNSAGLSPADRESTCLKFKPTPEWVFISPGLTWLFTILPAHLKPSSSPEQLGGLGQHVRAAYRWAAGKL